MEDHNQDLDGGEAVKTALLSSVHFGADSVPVGCGDGSGCCSHHTVADARGCSMPWNAEMAILSCT